MNDSAGKRLASFRASLGMSQREFAVALGISASTVGFIESDERTPSKAFLVKISDRYGVSADWLLHGRGEMIGAGEASPIPPAKLNPLILTICAGAARQEYETLGLKPDHDQQFEDAAWVYNELLARMENLSDGAELEAVMPQIRYLLRKKLAAGQ